MHHGLRDVVAIFPARQFAWTGASTAIVLADPAAHAAELCNPDATDQSFAAAKKVDLTVSITQSATPHSKHRLASSRRSGCHDGILSTGNPSLGSGAHSDAF